MCPRLINTIDFIAGLLIELENDLREGYHPVEANPLLDQLQEEAGNLTEIFNEFCMLKLQ